MRALEYIAALQRLVELHGNLEVQKISSGRRFVAPKPEIAFEQILKKGESAPRFVSEFEEDPARIGKAVFRI